jgi:predicted ABC-type ATPase
VSREKKVVIIAGPNGAGKTTFATEFLPNEAGCPVALADAWVHDDNSGQEPVMVDQGAT